MADIDTFKPYALPVVSPATLSLTLQPFDKLLATARIGLDELENKPPKHYELSPAVRIGPVEVRVKAFVYKQKPSGVPDICCEIIGDSAFTGFPWTAGVFRDIIRFRILDAERNVKFQDKWDVETESMYASDNFPKRVGQMTVLPFAGVSALKDCVDKNAIRIEVSMSVYVCLEILEEDQEVPIRVRIPLSLMSTKNTIPNNASLLESEELSDVKIVSRDGDRIPAHQVILAGSSPVFKTMFSTNMKEKSDGVVEIAAMGTKAVKVLLKFIYTGGFREEMEDYEIGTEVFLEVVRAGGVYEIPLLMRYAGFALLRRCDLKNALDLFSALKKYGELMRETVALLAGFIKVNIEDMVVDSD